MTTPSNPSTGPRVCSCSLYAQTPAAISRLTLEHVKTTDREVHLRPAREPIALPEPIAGLVVHLAARRRGHAALGDPKTSPWLFPGGRPRPNSRWPRVERHAAGGVHA